MCIGVCGVCVFWCVHVCVLVCVVCMCVFWCVLVCVCVCVGVCGVCGVYVCVLVCACVWAWAWACARACMREHVHAYECGSVMGAGSLLWPTATALTPSNRLLQYPGHLNLVAQLTCPVAPNHKQHLSQPTC